MPPAHRGDRPARVCLEATGIYSLDLALHRSPGIEVMIWIRPRPEGPARKPSANSITITGTSCRGMRLVMSAAAAAISVTTTSVPRACVDIPGGPLLTIGVRVL